MGGSRIARSRLPSPIDKRSPTVQAKVNLAFADKNGEYPEPGKVTPPNHFWPEV
jgi:hypothetical protein